LRRNLYPGNWEKISREIIERSGGRCECTGERPPRGCGLHRGRRCVERQRTPAVWFKGRVMLTTHHKNGKKHDSRRKNLGGYCQRCHLRADAAIRNERQKRAADLRAGQLRFWPLPFWP
jgi:hypothetical protein